MKKKGFTLIELLAVIVILSIVAIITVPIINNVIKNVRKKAFENTVYGLIESANVYYAEHLSDMEEGKEYLFDFDTRGGKTIDGEELAYKGEKPTGGYILLKSTGEVSVGNLTNGTYYASKETDESDITVGSSGSILTREQLTERLEKLENIVKNKTSLDQVYPVGSVYVSTTLNTVDKVNEKIGGTWEVYGSGRVLIGSGSNGTTSYTAGDTGGNETDSTKLTVANLPSHTHTISHTHTTPATSLSNGSAASAGAHTHTLPYGGFSYTGGNSWTGYVVGYTGWGTYPSTSNGAHTHTVTGTIPAMTTNSISTTESGAKGSGTAFTTSTVQPYVVVYMYKRIA